MYGGVLVQTGGVERAIDALRDGEPIAIAAAVLAALVVLGVVVVLLRWLGRRRRSPAAAFRACLAAQDAVAIVPHPDPDPDAMASAAATKHLAEHVGTPATIQYTGEIRHQENRAFRTVLDLDLDPIESADELAADAVVLVDHNRVRGLEDAGSVRPVAVVDHHPGDGTGSIVTDVRTECGSCASILAEYFEDLDAERYGPDEAVPATGEELTLPSDLATGLLYGVLSDTDNLTRGCSPVEYAASAYLSPAIDRDYLDRIANPQVDAEVLDVKARAIAERDTQPPYAVSDVGSLSNADAISQAADELLTLEGLTAVVVMGETEDTLHLSGRSRDDRVHMGRALQRATDDLADADAGGHARMGGGQVESEAVASLASSAGESRVAFQERLFDAMTGE